MPERAPKRSMHPALTRAAIAKQHEGHLWVVPFVYGGVRLPCVSSNVVAAWYNLDEGVLTIEYGGFVKWAYMVPVEKAVSFALAPSKGTWLWENVRVKGEGNSRLHQVPAWPVSG